MCPKESFFFQLGERFVFQGFTNTFVLRIKQTQQGDLFRVDDIFRKLLYIAQLQI